MSMCVSECVYVRVCVCGERGVVGGGGGGGGGGSGRMCACA